VASENAAMDSIVNLGEESSRESSRESSPPPQDSSTYFTPLSRPPRRNSLRSSSKIYSVSFQDCCCILHETTALEAKNRWRDAANFDEGPLNSPVIEIPRSADHFDRPDQSGDDDDEDEELDATDTSRIIAKTKSRRILSKSLDLKRGPNYNTIIGETSVSTSPKCKAPVVFCIHGNKYGVVKCCDSLSDENGHSHQDNAKLTGTINELSDEEASSSPRNRRHTSEQHCHTNTEGPTMDKKARNKLILASVLCLFFMTLEIIGGFLANSLAIAMAIRKMLKPNKKKKTSMSVLPLSMFWVISSRVLECLLPLSSSISDRIWSLSIRSVPSFSPSLSCSPLSEFSKIL